MISKDNYGEDHIKQLQLKSRKDPQLIERALYALGLLEALRLTGMEFIFKGGSCLMLLIPQVMRLSTDIDIIVTNVPSRKLTRLVRGMKGGNA